MGRRKINLYFIIVVIYYIFWWADHQGWVKTRFLNSNWFSFLRFLNPKNQLVCFQLINCLLLLIWKSQISNYVYFIEALM